MKHGKKAQGHITIFGLTMRESLSVCPQEQKKGKSVSRRFPPLDLARCDLAFVKHAIINPFLLREGHTDYVFDILVLSLDLGKDVVAGVLLHRLLRVSRHSIFLL